MSKETHDQSLARWAKRGKAGSEPVAAATVILLRDAPDGLETLMLRRNSKISFGGMWVFPGGRVDEADRAGFGAEDDMAVGRVAAAREAQEEAGLELAPADLVALSHWTPPTITPRRFLTWFFLAKAPSNDVVIDDGEIRAHAWMKPQDAIRQRDALEIELAPPTWVTLNGLLGWRSAQEAIAAAAACEPARYATHIAVGGDGPVALWHGDAGFETSDATVPGARHRLSMFEGDWRFERVDVDTA
jgi:8-oxo-dGTP pyrophosphatase MutT (NUDIX family)